MKIKTTREIWHENTRITPTPDELGREGRGIDLVYFESENSEQKWISVNDLIVELKDLHNRMNKQQKFETLQRYAGNMAIGVLILQAVFFIIALLFNTVQIFVTFYVLLAVLTIGAYVHKRHQLFGKKRKK
jgi:hypothetical protein